LTEINDTEYQKHFWANNFGDEYADRNTQNLSVIEETFIDFFKTINRDARILELGCNVGLKLQLLKKIGFLNLTGIEINRKAIEIAKKNNPDITFIHSSIEDYVSKGEIFDLVFTAGVLIHIHPTKLEYVVKKILSLSKKYIFGLEYYSDEIVEINYRGHSNVQWKQNFPLFYKKIFPTLQIIKQKKLYIYENPDLCDIAYLIKK